MATSAYIKLKDNDIHIYSHYDGHPENVVPILEDLIKRFIQVRGEDQPYLLAQIIRTFAAENIIEDMRLKLERKHKERFSSGGDYNGWGLTIGPVHKVNYLYEIDSKTGQLTINGKTDHYMLGHEE